MWCDLDDDEDNISPKSDVVSAPKRGPLLWFLFNSHFHFESAFSVLFEGIGSDGDIFEIIVGIFGLGPFNRIINY